MEPLQIWLSIVAFLSVFGVYQALFTNRIKTHQFSNRPEQVNGFAQRMFGAWVSVAFFVRLACALDPHNETVFLLTLGTFSVAFFVYAYETFVTRTIPVKNALGPFFVAGLSFGWMVLYKYNIV
eukprot:TRINITY_DN3590_c0_g1_i1.p2 TRINITY_DN3590_c0_g1~~TRINITY_DN3590_c0_g1_i1.p2  ORF type:complete len:141 (+),score=54.53 TRINITY_DN3590_c0_g1_i1:54-425(+)